MRYATSEGYYSIDAMPNQPSIAICSDFTVLSEFRGRKAAHLLKAHQMDQLKLLHFTTAICTIQNSNEAQIKVVGLAGWRPISEFFDARTNSFARIWIWEVQ